MTSPPCASPGLSSLSTALSVWNLLPPSLLSLRAPQSFRFPRIPEVSEIQRIFFPHVWWNVPDGANRAGRVVMTGSHQSARSSLESHMPESLETPAGVKEPWAVTLFFLLCHQIILTWGTRSGSTIHSSVLSWPEPSPLHHEFAFLALKPQTKENDLLGNPMP